MIRHDDPGKQLIEAALDGADQNCFSHHIRNSLVIQPLGTGRSAVQEFILGYKGTTCCGIVGQIKVSR